MKSVRAYRYRWLILVSLMLLVLSVDLHWMALAPVVRAADIFYHGQFDPSSFVNVDFLALVYLIVFVVMSIPASFFIEKFGITVSLRIAAAMVVVGSIGKWLYAADFASVIGFQILLAFARPLIFNGITTVTMRWFPLRDRGFASGMVAFSQYLALGLVMVFSPLFVGTDFGAGDYGTGIDGMMQVYGIVCAAMALVAGLLIREQPPTPASFEPAVSLNFRSSYKNMFRNRSLLGLLAVFSFGWGYFINLAIKIDGVGALVGIEDSNALLGVVLFSGGIAGALAIPAISDRVRRRRRIMVVCGIGAICGGLSLTFPSFFSFWVLSPQVVAFVGAGILGFFLMGAGPLGLQYAAELSRPVPETATQSLFSACSSFVCVFMVLFATVGGGAYLRLELLLIHFLAVGGVFLLSAIKESPTIVTEDERLQAAVKKEIVHLE